MSRELSQLARDRELEAQDLPQRAQLKLRKEVSKEPGDDSEKLESLRANLVRKGYRNVSDCVFTASGPPSVGMELRVRVLRSQEYTVATTLDWFLPPVIHNLYFDGCNSFLRQKRQKMKQNKKKGSTMSSRYREMTWREYWKYWETHIYSCVHGFKNQEALFSKTLPEDREKFLPFNRYRYIHTCMRPVDISALGLQCSLAWCSQVTRPKWFVWMNRFGVSLHRS